MLQKENIPLVSIALCIYNGERFLKEQLETLVNQTYKNIEIVAVDDCSTDSSVLILETYKAKYPFINIHRNARNLGYVKNFEKAISLCKGDFIALSDQDDIWDPDKIKLQAAQIEPASRTDRPHSQRQRQRGLPARVGNACARIFLHFF